MKPYSYALTAIALTACQMAAAQTTVPAAVVPATPAAKDASSLATPAALAPNAPAAEPRIIRGNDQVVAPAKVVPGFDGPPVSFNFEEAAIAEVVRTILGDILKADYVLHPPLSGTVTLATRAPVLIFPAMNVHMWEHEATQEHVGRLRELGYFVFEPEEGELACGYEGKGRLPSVDVILEEIWRSLCPKKDLKGKHVLVTAGPTWEFIDPVRFLSNPSSGKMGYAMARTAWYRGAEVVLVSGPVDLPQPHWAHLVSATSAEEMGRAVMEHLSWADVIVKAAAVSDFRAEERKSQKIKRQGRDKLDLQLVQNPDIAAAVGLNKRQDQLLIGFAAESEDLLENARSKMARKGLDMIVVNDITAPGAGFASDTNVVKVLDPKGAIAELKGSKEAVADAIWEIVTTRLPSAR